MWAQIGLAKEWSFGQQKIIIIIMRELIELLTMLSQGNKYNNIKFLQSITVTWFEWVLKNAPSIKSALQATWLTKNPEESC